MIKMGTQLSMILKQDKKGSETIVSTIRFGFIDKVHTDFKMRQYSD